MIEIWQNSKSALKTVEEEEKSRRSAVLKAMGDAEGADGGEMGSVTYMTQSRKSLNAKALQADHPEIWEEYQKTSTYPVLRFRKPRKEKVDE